MWRQQIVAVPARQIHGEEITAARMTGAAKDGHYASIVNIGTRRDAPHPKVLSFGARLLAPCHNLRYALRGLGFTWPEPSGCS
jgi:hypothetical protein